MSDSHPEEQALSIGQWIEHAVRALTNAGYDDSARLDAQLLVSTATGYSRTALYAHPEVWLSNEQTQCLNALLKRRLSGEPMAYLSGQREFWSLPLQVTPAVLIPRPESELLVETALALQAETVAGPIADLGTGSGAIAIALAQDLPERYVIGIECSEAALAVARQNNRTIADSQVALIQGRWLESIAAGTLAMIVANPPYLAADDPHLPSLSFEPTAALISQGDGLDDIRSIISQVRVAGKPGAWLLLEHGYQQGQAVRALLRAHGYEMIATRHDLAGHERVSCARLPTGSSL